MSTAVKTPVTKLAPVECKNESAAKAQASADGRKRGILAINEHGALVVCCRRTAKKNGWSVQEALYKKTAAPAVAEAPVEVAKPAKTKPVKAAAEEPVKAPKKPRTKKSDVSELL